jgi:hypothetical protein
MSQATTAPAPSPAEGDAGGNTAEALMRRMMELREQYRVNRGQLGAPVVATRKGGRAVPANTSLLAQELNAAVAAASGAAAAAAGAGGGAADSGESSGSEDVPARTKHSGGGASRAGQNSSRLGNSIVRKVPSADIDLELLPVVVRGAIQDQNGSAHVDTIAEVVRQRWPNMRKKDGNGFVLADYRRLLQQHLKSGGVLRSLLARDRYHELSFTLRPDTHPDPNKEEESSEEEFDLDDEVTDRTDSVANVLYTAMEGMGGSASFEDIFTALNEKWAGKPRRPVEEFRDIVRICLNTNPRFLRDTKPVKGGASSNGATHETYAILPRGQQPQTQQQNVAAPANKRKGAQQAPPPEIKREDRIDPGNNKRRRKETYDEEVLASAAAAAQQEDDEEDEEGARNRRGPPPKRGAKREASPPPVKASKTDTFAVINTRAPRAAKVEAQKQAATAGRGNPVGVEEKGGEDSNPWICCDGCNKWLKAKSDNIEDMWIYDDANPNHLDYYCPKCRKKREEEGLASSSVAPHLSAAAAKAAAHDAAEAARKSKRTGASTRGHPVKDSGDSGDGVMETQSPPAQPASSAMVKNPVDHSGVGASSSALHGASGNKKGGNKAGRSGRRRDEDEAEPLGKLDIVERDLFAALEREKPEPALRDRLEEEVAKHKQTLLVTRRQQLEAHQREYEQHIEALEKAREAQDERTDEEVARQLREFFEKRKQRLRTEV